MKLRGKTNLFGSFCISVILAVLGTTLSYPASADWFSTPLSQRQMCHLYSLKHTCSHRGLASAINASNGRIYAIQPRFGFVEFAVTQTRTGGSIKRIRWIDDGQLPANRSPFAFNFNLALHKRFNLNWEEYASKKIYPRPKLSLSYGRSWFTKTDTQVSISGTTRDREMHGRNENGAKLAFRLDTLYVPYNQKESSEVFELAWHSLNPNPVTGRPELGLSLSF